MSSILWRRLDRPGHEAARLGRVEDGFVLEGTAIFGHQAQPCSLDYMILCDEAWQTRGARVAGWIGAQEIDVEIVVDDGQWLLNDKKVREVKGCIDLDLNFSPSTNLLPIRRLNLEIGAEAVVKAAWLRFPSFTLEQLEQTYRRTGRHTYRYESAGGAFVRDLVVNDDGLVTRYPDFWDEETS